MTKEEIIQRMVDEMPFDLERRIVPYISEAMTIYAESKAKEAWNAARETETKTWFVDWGGAKIQKSKTEIKYADYETYKTKQNA